MFDLRIDNGRVIDGTGNVWYRADIGITDGKIVKINTKLKGKTFEISCNQGGLDGNSA